MTDILGVSLSNWLHLALVFGCTVAIGCRLNYMGAGTKHCISALYIGLGSLVGISIAFPSSLMLLLALSFTAGVLASDYEKWKFAQPQYTLNREIQHG